MMQDELENLYRSLLPQIRREMERGELMARVFILNAEKKLTMVLMPFCDNRDKKIHCAFVDDRCAEENALGMIFFSETWVLRREGKSFEEMSAELPEDFSEAPDKEQALWALLLTHGWQQSLTTRFTRDGRRVRFAEEQNFKEGMEQRMFHYFKRWLI